MVSRPVLRLGLHLAALFAAGAGAQAAWNAGYLATFAVCFGLGAWAVSRIVAGALERRGDGREAEGDMQSALLAREREARALSAYLDHAPVPLLAMRSRGTLSAINLAARRAFATDDALRDPPQTLVAAILGLQPGVRQSLSLDFSGRPRTYALTVAELVSEGDLVRIAALTDIQAEVQAAEAAALRELMLVLSHEIMNSMTPVTSLAQSTAGLLREIDLQDDRIDDARAAVDSLARRSEGLLGFVEGYRALARLPEPHRVPTDLSEVLADLARLFRSRWSERGVDLRFETEPMPMRSIDGALVSQALLNVLTNAAEAAVEGGRPPEVRLSAWGETDSAVVEIQDNGAGLSLAPELIFRPFMTTKADGTGIGLSIARQIVRAHGGEIAVTLTDATGTVVRVSL